MNFIVNSQTLAAELRALAKIAPAKPAIPILSHVLLTATDTLRLAATDLEVAMRTTCAAQIAEPGVIALPAARLLGLVEQFTDGDVLLKTDKQQVTIQCGAFKSRLQALPADDFPALPEPEGASTMLDGVAFRQMINRTRYAIGSDDSRYLLKGALLVLSATGAAMVATDSRRLALATSADVGDARVILPTKTLDALAAQKGDIELTVGERHLFFATGDRLLVSRTIDGTFPAYERIIPRDNAHIVTVDRAALTAALRRVNLVSEDNRAVYFDVNAGQLALSSSSAEVGSADEVVKADYSGPALKVCINGGYMLDFLNAASNTTVTLAMKDENSPALFSDGDHSIAVIMPMRL